MGTALKVIGTIIAGLYIFGAGINYGEAKGRADALAEKDDGEEADPESPKDSNPTV